MKTITSYRDVIIASAAVVGLSAAVVLAYVAVLNPIADAQQIVTDPDAVLEVEEIRIKTTNGQFSFSAEIADEEHERSTGLMFRTAMKPTHGMLFDFGTTGPVSMWMENTHLPLDMIFIRPDGSVARIARNTVPFSREIISSTEPVSHVLELNAGISAQIGLKPGDTVHHRFFGNAE